jgi:phage tail P2-like protein
MSTDSLLPPNATPLETGLARLGQRLSAVELPIADLWNPQTCPLPALPWLAWTLSVDTWDTDWTEERKRAITAGAIAAQRRKGSVAVVREALRTIDERLELVEADPAVSPMPLPCACRCWAVMTGRRRDRRRGRSGGDRQPDRGRPVPRGAGALATQSGDRAGPCRPRRGRGRRAPRSIAACAGPDATGINWAGLLTNEMGEPLADDSGQFIDGSA